MASNYTATRKAIEYMSRNNTLDTQKPPMSVISRCKIVETPLNIPKTQRYIPKELVLLRLRLRLLLPGVLRQGGKTSGLIVNDDEGVAELLRHKGRLPD